MDRRALSQLLSHKRELIDPAEYGLEPRPAGRGPHVGGLSQSQMDQLTHRADGTYGKFERLALAGASPDFVETVARILRLDEQEWSAMWNYAFQQAPPFLLHPEAAGQFGGHWQEALNGITHMACVEDAGWNLKLANARFAEMFPGGRPPPNLMEWMLFDPDARTKVLLNWEECWAPRLLPQLRAAFARHPYNTSLRALDEKVNADSVAGPIYRQGTEAYLQPNGDRQPMWHAGLEKRGWLRVAVSFLGGSDARLAILMFHPDEQAGR